MAFVFNPKLRALRQQLLAFMEEHVDPNDARHDAELAANAKAGRAYAELRMMAGLKARARERGLWNLFLPPRPDDSGEAGHVRGLTNMEDAPLAEIMGGRYWCSEICNCSAPDTGNMEVLARYAKAQQEPLAQALPGRPDSLGVRDGRARRGIERRHQHCLQHPPRGR